MERCVTLPRIEYTLCLSLQLQDNSSESKNFHGCWGSLLAARLAPTYSILLRINCSFDRVVAPVLRLLSAFSVNENFVPLLAVLCRPAFPRIISVRSTSRTFSALEASVKLLEISARNVLLPCTCLSSVANYLCWCGHHFYENSTSGLFSFLERWSHRQHIDKRLARRQTINSRQALACGSGPAQIVFLFIITLLNNLINEQRTVFKHVFC